MAIPICKKRFILCPAAHQLLDEDRPSLLTDFVDLVYFTNSPERPTQHAAPEARPSRRLKADHHRQQNPKKKPPEGG
jgi:hypothetical protein